MKLTVDLTVDNAAFDPHPRFETARILHKLADDMELDTRLPGSLFDVNGNRVGSVTIETTL